MTRIDHIAQTPAGDLESGLAAHQAYTVRGVHFRYGLSRPQGEPWVLRDVTLEVAQGEILGIVGPNGSGKTSLLKLLAKLAVPQEGEIALFGRPLRSLSPELVAQSVAVVPQDSPQMFPFTVAETVVMGRFPHRRRAGWSLGFGWEDREDCQAASQAMATMDIAHLAGRAVTDLSGGERQRTMIARALAQAPRVLLLDEPTAFLDLQHQLEICSVLRRLSDEQGLTVVIVSHDLNLASQYCDRIVMLKEGAMYSMGTPSEVLSVEALRAVYGCEVLIDPHPESGLPRVTLPRQAVPFRS
ncbi:MAG: ABC transporter ATP-binding protein [Fimbriimonadaceae bacterium]|nr:ABC transporter ATP-binding protein [Fimbriimonadaceae bacterium]MBX3649542.1 ABC transporter ATP-binding protein [Rhodocyclaceae bacterium]